MEVLHRLQGRRTTRRKAQPATGSIGSTCELRLHSIQASTLLQAHSFKGIHYNHLLYEVLVASSKTDLKKMQQFKVDLNVDEHVDTIEKPVSTGEKVR